MSFPCQFPRQGPHREEGMTSLASIEENRPFPWRISGGGTGEKSLHFMPFGQGEAHPKWPGPSEGRFSRCVMCQQCSPLPQAHRSLGLRALWSSLRPGLASGLRYCTLTGFLFLFFFPSNWAWMHIGLSSGRAGAGSRPSVGALCNVLSLAKDLAKESQKDYTAALDSVQLPVLSPVHFF